MKRSTKKKTARAQEVQIDFSSAEYGRTTKPPEGRRSVAEFDRWMHRVAAKESPAGGYNKSWPKVYIGNAREPILEMRIDIDRRMSEGRSFREILENRIAFNTRKLKAEPTGRMADDRRAMIPVWRKILKALAGTPRAKTKGDALANALKGRK